MTYGLEGWGGGRRVYAQGSVRAARPSMLDCVELMLERLARQTRELRVAIGRCVP